MSEMDVVKAEMDRIESAYQGVFERIERAQTEEEREYVLYVINSKWCSCGKDLGECIEHGGGSVCGCGTPYRTVLVDQCPKCEWLKVDTVRIVQEESNQDAKVGMLGNEDHANPHLFTAGKDEDGSWIYPFMDSFYADSPEGIALLALLTTDSTK